MINQQPPELFAERPVRSDFARARSYRVRRIATCLIAAGMLGGGIYSIYLWHRGPAEIPTIKAELPLKQKPEQPGGIDIPNQDVLAYQQIDNSGANQPPVEHLLPPPEAPQAGSAPAPAPAAPPAAAPAIETLGAPPPPPMVTTVSPQHPAPPAAVTQAPAAAPAPEPPPAAALAASPADITPPAAAPPAPVPDQAANASESSGKPATGRKGFRIQLASFPDKETAATEMEHMEKKYAAHLGSARLHLAKADLGSRGIYYRVQSNPVTDIEARDICAALKNLKAGCIIVKP